MSVATWDKFFDSLNDSDESQYRTKGWVACLSLRPEVHPVAVLLIFEFHSHVERKFGKIWVAMIYFLPVEAKKGDAPKGNHLGLAWR